MKQLDFFYDTPKFKQDRYKLLLDFFQKKQKLTKYQSKIVMLSALGITAPKQAQMLKKNSALVIRSAKSYIKKNKLGGKTIPDFIQSCLIDQLIHNKVET